MPWPWSSPTRSDEELRDKDYDVAEVRHEVGHLVVELKSVLKQIEERLAEEGESSGSAPNR